MRKAAKLFCLLILALAGATSCSKKENGNDAPAPDASAPAKTKFYFRGTIDGVAKDWTVTDYFSSTNGGWGNSRYYFNGASGADALGNDCQNTYCKYMFEDVVIAEWNGPGPTRNYIAAGFHIGSKTGDRNEIISQFAAGNKVFGKPRRSINDPVKDGVYVYYIDQNGKDWYTGFGAADQSTSVFKSLGLLPQPNPQINCSKIWKAEFSCTLYDRNENAIQLKNCEIYCPVLVKK